MKPFPWRPGMRSRFEDWDAPIRVLACDDTQAWVIHENDAMPIAFVCDLDSLHTPDPNDGATLGALLAEVQRVWGFDDLYPRHVHEGRMPNVWYAAPRTGDEPPFKEGWGFLGRCVKEHELARRVGVQATKWDAVLAAWEAAP